MSRKKKRKKQKLSFGSSRSARQSIALSVSRFDVDRRLQRAVQYHQSGQLQKAEKVYKAILKVDPNHSVCLNLLGIIAHERGKTDLAVSLIGRAIQNDPKNPIYYTNLGNALKEQGAFDEAIACCQKALELQPGLAAAYNNLGVAFQAKNNLDEAIACFQKALQSKPDYAEAHNNLGLALREQGRLDEAISYCQKAVQLRLDYAEGYNNLALMLRERGRLNEAISCWEKAVRIRPDNGEAYKNLGTCLQEQGRVDEAHACYKKAFESEADAGIQVKRSLLLPPICRSREAIEQSRRSLTEQIESLQKENLRLEDPYKQVAATQFLLAYHGLNDKELQEKIAHFYIHACPDLAWTSPNCSKQKRVAGRIEIGIISSYLYDHTIGSLNLGILRKLSRDKFYIKLLRFSGKEDRMSEAINAAADEVVALPTELTGARQRIAEHSLDILFYLDIGMDPLTYFLSFSRLAPVQCVTWGHPVTTGVPNIDYFISSDNAEPSDGEAHYSERMVRLGRLGIYYYRPELSEEIPSPERYDLPKGHNLYLCPQSLFKFHPDFDGVLGAILRQDSRALLILVEGAHDHWTTLLRERFVVAFPDAIDRVRFLPRVPKKDFLSLLRVADVVLDTTCFGGGKTSLECFACGVPVVTWPAPFLRGRLTLAMYKQMGVMDCVASDAESYVDIALRLANDKTWRNEIKAKILSHADVLYEDIEAVRELERFFEWAIKENSKKTAEPHYFS